jgi:hypothetical protein
VSRPVRYAQSFWDEVSAYFPPERDGRGGASLADFEAVVLPAIEFQLARGYDELPDAVPDAPLKLVIVQTPLGLAGAYAHLVGDGDAEFVNVVGFMVDTSFGGVLSDEE